MIKQITDRCVDFPQIGEKMDTKFTPGPWDVGVHELKFGDVDSVDIYADEAISGFKLPAVTFGGNCEANAHLIAAAPDMYNLLSTIMEIYDGRSTLSGEIEAVLAKARGE